MNGALFFLIGGDVYDGKLQYAGTAGRYWSNTAHDTLRAYYFNFEPSGVYPATNALRSRGYSIRCVAR